jgi:NitT/TauT family transport system permease protein
LRLHRAGRNSIPAIAVLLILLALWQFVAQLGFWSDWQFPRPARVLDAFRYLAGQGLLLPSLLATLRRLFYGFGISLLVGGSVAFMMARFVSLRRGIKPYLLGLQSLPSLAWVPLALLWFGVSEDALIFVTVIGSVFAVTISLTDALGSVRPVYIKAARTMGSRGMGLILRVLIPAALPPIVSGAKQGWSFAWRSLVGAEIIFAAIGLGFLLNVGRDLGDFGQVFAVMLMTLFVGLLFEVFVFSSIETWVRRRWGLLG